MYKTKLFAVAAMAALLTACQGGQATPPPQPDKVTKSDDRQVSDFDRGVALGHFKASCAEGSGPDGVRCFAYMLTASGRTEARAREALSGSRSISATTPGGYGPAQLQAAYKTAPATGGTGRLVAIVDSGDAPTLEADLAVYRTQFGLPPCTSATGCFRKVNQTGGLTYPAVDASWAQETSLDVDMVSANCPNCSILVVETNSASFADLSAGVNTAASLGAVAISNSYGGRESSSETSIAPAYNHAGIAITASNGDSGYGAQSPAAFNTLTAVGGTSLNTATNARGWSETVWSGTGSGCSAYISKPSWQHDTGCSRRTIGDVAYIGDPYTGVAVYDSTPYNGSSGWMVFGGTSVGAPAIAAIYALAGNTVSNASLAYSNSASLFDVTSGSDGHCRNSVSYLCTGKVGYDGPTGFGTPNGTGAF